MKLKLKFSFSSNTQNHYVCQKYPVKAGVLQGSILS